MPRYDAAPRSPPLSPRHFYVAAPPPIRLKKTSSNGWGLLGFPCVREHTANVLERTIRQTGCRKSALT